MKTQPTLIERLLDKGVVIHCPDSVYISPEVNPDRISGDNVTLYPGTRLYGESTLISPGSTLGYEAPVTLENTCVGPDCQLKGGFFQASVFLGKNNFGSGAHVRAGTILEEEASAAHTVGLKQTILFPFVTLGSLINFCDCLMAGGTSRRDHSEVGSSFIHFNYTPNQDKATPSLLGNVTQGVMLNNRPVFLGGQGGLVGPRRLAFGCTTAAGTICRRDEDTPGRLIFGSSLKSGSMPKNEGVYINPKAIYTNNCIYTANLLCLRLWYRFIRSLFVRDMFSKELVRGLNIALALCIDERVKRLDQFCTKLQTSRSTLLASPSGSSNTQAAQHTAVLEQWARGRNALTSFDPDNEDPPPASFLKGLQQGIESIGPDYIGVINQLSSDISELGTIWLKTIENRLLGMLLP